MNAGISRHCCAYEWDKLIEIERRLNNNFCVEATIEELKTGEHHD